MQRLYSIVAAVLVVGLLYASLTAFLPMTGLEGLLLLSLLITLAVVCTRRRRLVPQRLVRGHEPARGSELLTLTIGWVLVRLSVLCARVARRRRHS